MKWIKASERLPGKEGRYFVKTDRQWIPNNNEVNQVATFNKYKEWFLENHHHSNDLFWIRPFEWLDESNEGEERKFSLEEALGMLMEFAVLYHKSERKDIANDAAEYLTDKFNIDI